MDRRPLIAGNWKMVKTRAEARTTAVELDKLVARSPEVDVAVFPPFTALSTVSEVLQGTAVKLGAQNVHWEDEGAFTGEISVRMLEDCGCRYVIIGHSERRLYFSESDEIINHKLKQVLTSALIPILCVGESLEEREAGRVAEIVLRQVERAWDGLASSQEVSRIIVAYEPVWAIGTGKTATPEIAEEVHSLIRESISSRYSQELSHQIRILYGGSVKPENIGELMRQPNIDGALVGGASLEAESFARILRYNAGGGS